jgi:hypothetical protein
VHPVIKSIATTTNATKEKYATFVANQTAHGFVMNHSLKKLLPVLASD